MIAVLDKVLVKSFGLSFALYENVFKVESNTYQTIAL